MQARQEKILQQSDSNGVIKYIEANLCRVFAELGLGIKVCARIFGFLCQVPVMFQLIFVVEMISIE